MKSLTKIIEALPVSGYKPAGPYRPRGPAKPAKAARVRAQVMTPKGRLATVKKPSSMRKPGYQFIKYTLPPSAKPAKPSFSGRDARNPKKPIEPVGSGVNEMKVTKFRVSEEEEQWQDPGHYPSGMGGHPLSKKNYYTLEGFAEVEVDENDIKGTSGQVDLENEVKAEIEAEIQEKFGSEANKAITLVSRKIGKNTYRVEIKNSKLYKENTEPKSLTQLIAKVIS